MENRQGSWLHPLMTEPRAGEREIRMRLGKALPIARGRENADGE